MKQVQHLSEDQILNALDKRGLKYKVGGRYILTQCPVHDDRSPSAQIYRDDFFINCHVCGRISPFQAFEELRESSQIYSQKGFKMQNSINSQPTRKEPVKTQYRAFNLIKYWQKLEPLKKGIKGIPAEHLNDLGWRENDGTVIAGEGIFIPYFSKDKKAIPFAQVRHFEGERRFTFLKDAKPKCYGVWNLEPGDKLFVVEGASDCAVLDYCQIPWIGLPSASSGQLLKEMAEYCHKNNIELVYAGDRDGAGDKLREALDEVIPYRVCQAPEPFKDYGDFFEKRGMDAVMAHAYRELYN